MCDDHRVLPLRVERYDGWPTSMYLEVTSGGQRGVLHVDTASPYTVLVSEGDDGFVFDAATIEIGCQQRRVATYSGAFGALPDVDGLPVLGSAGIDLFSEAPTLLNVVDGLLITNPNDNEQAAVRDAVEVQHEWAQDVVVLQASFDGAPKRLILDTGSAHSVWLGEARRDGDIEHVTEDYLGRPLTVYEGTVELGLGGHTFTLPILRAPTFPILEDWRERLGGDLDGLLGLSAIDALLIDKHAGTLRIAADSSTQHGR